jgi:hypothetical protein
MNLLLIALLILAASFLTIASLIVIAMASGYKHEDMALRCSLNDEVEK